MDSFELNPSTGIPSIKKDPAASLPYTLDLYEYLRADDLYWNEKSFYHALQTITPSKGKLNGHRYRADNAGVRGATEPVWPIGSGATVVDGSITWREIGAEDTINSIPCTVPAGITLVSQTNTATTTTINLSTGTKDNTYRCSFRITTVSGRVDERSIDVVVRER